MKFYLKRQKSCVKLEMQINSNIPTNMKEIRVVDKFSQIR